jgi:hypothetical protein
MREIENAFKHRQGVIDFRKRLWKASDFPNTIKQKIELMNKGYRLLVDFLASHEYE